MCLLLINAIGAEKKDIYDITRCYALMVNLYIIDLLYSMSNIQK